MGTLSLLEALSGSQATFGKDKPWPRDLQTHLLISGHRGVKAASVYRPERKWNRKLARLEVVTNVSNVYTTLNKLNLNYRNYALLKV